MNTDSLPKPSPKNAQAALRRLADSANMLVWMADVNDDLIYLNRSASSLFENGLRINVSDWFQFLHPDDLARVSPVVRKAKESRSEYQVEYRVIRSDGTARWVMGCAAPRFSDGGDYLGYNGTVIDVADRHTGIENLVKSEASYRLLADNSSDLISHHAPDSGTYLYTSPSFRRVLGFEPSELVGTTSIYDQVHPDDEKIIRAEILRQLREGADSRIIEFRIRHRDGHYLWMGTNVKLLTNPVTNEKIGAVAVSRDITSERLAKNELKKREERFRGLTNLSSDWYWETDEEGRFTFISDTAERIFGTAPEEFIGKNRIEFAKDRGQPGLLKYMNSLAGKDAFKDIRYFCDWPAREKRLCVSLSGEPVFENDVFTGYRGVGRDITEEVEAAEQFARLADERKALIENSLDMMVIIDQDGRFVRANAAVTEILGYLPEEVVGRAYVDLIVPEERETARTVDAELRTGRNTVYDFELRCVRKDGSVRHLSWAVRWADDKKVMYATGRDVTERYIIRTELQKSKDRLSSMLESIGDAFFTLDGNWRVTYLNQKTARFISRERDSVMGRIVWDAVPEILTSTVFPYYQKAMATRKPLAFEEYWAPSSAWVEVRVYPQDDGIAVYFHDITARRETEQIVRESERRFRDIIEMTPAGYILADAQATFLDINPALCAMSGFSKDELIGHGLQKLFSYCPWHGALSVQHGPTSAHGVEAVIQHRNGHDVHVLFSGSIKRDGDGHAQSFTAFLTDITARKQAESRLAHLAAHDTLTGLPNRSFLNERLQHMLDFLPRDESIAVMFIDLDRFKEVNDSMGHAPGDILLCAVAERLQKSIRPSDIVARLGGDEFVVAAHCAAGAESAAMIARKLLATLAAPFDIAGQEVFVGASIGISMYPQDGKTKELLFQSADTAMYRAKASGRNGYRFFEAEMSVEAKTRMALETSLRRALERKEFELHYQPRLDLKTMTVVGMEALIRWNHPQLGQVSPVQFIPIAEERGLIESIGQWVLEEACMQTRRLMDRFGHPLRISVNLSPRQLRCVDLVQQVESVLKKTHLPPGLLELELTENALVDDLDVSATTLRKLKELGISLAVDDFGTGYSALAYLQSFPLDILKLDRSFLSQRSAGTNHAQFIRAFVDLAHALNLSVVAEGVETQDALDFLSKVACDEVQGYLLSQPLPLDEFERFLSRLPGLEMKKIATTG